MFCESVPAELSTCQMPWVPRALRMCGLICLMWQVKIAMKIELQRFIYWLSTTKIITNYFDNQFIHFSTVWQQTKYISGVDRTRHWRTPSWALGSKNKVFVLAHIGPQIHWFWYIWNINISHSGSNTIFHSDSAENIKPVFLIKISYSKVKSELFLQSSGVGKWHN